MLELQIRCENIAFSIPNGIYFSADVKRGFIFEMTLMSKRDWQIYIKTTDERFLISPEEDGFVIEEPLDSVKLRGLEGVRIAYLEHGFRCVEYRFPLETKGKFLVMNLAVPIVLPLTFQEIEEEPCIKELLVSIHKEK